MSDSETGPGALEQGDDPGAVRGSVRLVPLGGLGEIGMNCLCVEQDDGILVVDAGISFPHDDLGIDVYHPDFSWLERERERVSGVFITHGHEDHIGALPYLLDAMELPVWGPPHALAMIRRKLAERGFDPDEYELRETRPRERYQVGPFEVEPLRVAHSIVDATALAIHSDAGLLLHTGDFNFDDDPPDGEPTDAARLCQLGDQGVALLLSDSTNVDVPQRPGSERQVGAALEELIASASGRVVVALFASNVHRLVLLGDIAQRLGKKICLLGRSLRTQHAIGHEIGRLAWPSDLLVGPEQLAELAPQAVLVLAGGTQGEANSALTRIAAGTHRDLKLEGGDTVIVSARIIPGNERAVLDVLGNLLRQGVTVHTSKSQPEVHTSGHAGRSEQSRMLELTRPQAFMPLHGTLHHLLRHAELAREHGVSSVAVAENGTSVRFDGSQLALDRPERWGKVAVAHGGRELLPVERERRAELGRAGLLAASVVIDRQGRSAAPAFVTCRGVPGVDDDVARLRALSRVLGEALDTVAPARREQESELGDRLRRALRRSLLEMNGTRPRLELHLIWL